MAHPAITAWGHLPAADCLNPSVLALACHTISIHSSSRVPSKAPVYLGISQSHTALSVCAGLVNRDRSNSAFYRINMLFRLPRLISPSAVYDHSFTLLFDYCQKANTSKKMLMNMTWSGHLTVWPRREKNEQTKKTRVRFGFLSLFFSHNLLLLVFLVGDFGGGGGERRGRGAEFLLVLNEQSFRFFAVKFYGSEIIFHYLNYIRSSAD